MTISESSWPYWAVDLPGLSQTQAEALLAMAHHAGMPNGGTVVDPRRFLTLHLDGFSVQSLLRALNFAMSEVQQTDLQIVAGIVEVLREWNETASSQ
jgi:hypothetical protein